MLTVCLISIFLPTGVCSTPSCASMVSSVTTASDLISLASDTDIQLQPPPLPPRRRTTTASRDSVSSTASSDHVFMRSPEPPEVPPRSDPDQPPPVPPRRDSMYNTNSLSRSHSHSHVPVVPVSGPRTPTLVSQTQYTRSATASIPPVQVRTQSASQLSLGGMQGQVHCATLPRYHGGSRDSRNSDNSENIFNFNGESSDIPEIPPKTYRHARKQSS